MYRYTDIIEINVYSIKMKKYSEDTIKEVLSEYKDSNRHIINIELSENARLCNVLTLHIQVSPDTSYIIYNNVVGNIGTIIKSAGIAWKKIEFYNVDHHSRTAIMYIDIIFHIVLIAAAYIMSGHIINYYLHLKQKMLIDYNKHYVYDVLKLNKKYLINIFIMVFAACSFFISACLFINLRIQVHPSIIPIKIINIRDMASKTGSYYNSLRDAHVSSGIISNYINYAYILIRICSINVIIGILIQWFIMKIHKPELWQALEKDVIFHETRN
ncbi:MAG: hypothetical protein PHG48_03675 [Eubacteriales bacterium]|nr:hypothetical protein [Eubacteriales bacterium]